ncbi:MAG: hypothetical protein CVT92_02095 [Bacteroidetes bacterium HGW-Bacteroidetes-1]|jgi:hypothetical protein|nr:MAG: hypothetical protein CVT92_02095 [Bacteroidetes bacterium HGW-Bacteroidetes-1]
MNKELVSKLEAIIAKMDIPFYRKTIKNKDNVRWLNRNIAVRNSQNPALPEAMNLIKELL